MLRLLVAFTTYDGHTAKIAERIASTLAHADCAVEVCDLARSRPGTITRRLLPSPWWWRDQFANELAAR